MNTTGENSTDALAGLHEGIRDLFQSNPYSVGMNIRIMHAVPGEALVTVGPKFEMLNRHSAWHGGAIWTLADMVFGAAGYYDGFMFTVGSDLTFIRPAPGDQPLFGYAREVTRKGKTGIFQISISTDHRSDDAVVAAGTFTGRWTENA